MKVAFATLAPFISGAERSLQITIQALQQYDVEPYLLGPPGNALVPWCLEHGVQFLPVYLAFRDRWHPFRWWASVREARRQLRLHRIDLVHSNQVWSYPTVGAAALQEGIPRVVHMRDEVPPEAVRWFCQSGVEGVLCISRHIEEMVCPSWPTEPLRPLIKTLINPVKLPPLDDLGEKRQKARQSLQIDPDCVVFGFVGQIVPIKGLQILLEALAALPCHKPWLLLVAGRDPGPGALHEIYCRQWTQQRGLSDRVRFLGFLEDTDSFYQALDLAVVPSLSEPLGRIPLEAAAQARPSLAFAVGGLVDTIRHGETGWLIPPEVRALQRSLQQYLENPQPECGVAARAWVEKVADPMGYAKQLVKLYEELLGRNASKENSQKYRINPK